MPLFDFYIMADWSGGARRRGGRSDSIWIAHGPITADGPLTDSPYSRTEAIRLIHSLLVNQIRSKRRVLLCFDFAYGYPVDFAAALQAATGKSDRDLPWLLMWQYLSEHIKDDEGTAPGAKPSNRSNRFEVANQINALLSADPKAAGPFWCASSEAAYRREWRLIQSWRYSARVESSRARKTISSWKRFAAICGRLRRLMRKVERRSCLGPSYLAPPPSSRQPAPANRTSAGNHDLASSPALNLSPHKVATEGGL
jgi:hypothetical protein